MEELVISPLQVSCLASIVPMSLERKLSSVTLGGPINLTEDLKLLVEKVKNIDSSPPLKISFPADVPFQTLKLGLLALCALSGEALQVEDELAEYWYSLGVDKYASPVAANGTGPNPLHLDMLTFSNFPTGMAILCERPDPKGGGATILSPHAKVCEVLTEDEIELLKLPVYSYWRDEGLINVGEHLEKHSILSTPEDPRFRFTSKFVRRFELHPPNYPDPDSASVASRAINKISKYLESQALRINLRSREAVVYSQLQFCHGRSELGDGQHLVEDGKRRQLWRMYFNSGVGSS